MRKALWILELDVHAKSLTLTQGGGDEARIYGTLPNDRHALEKVFAKLKKAHPGVELRVCYDAGELSAVPVPDASDEAMRDLCRARHGRWGNHRSGGGDKRRWVGG